MNNDQFPDGQLNDEDEGVLTTAIGIEDGRVHIRWPKLISWIAFDPDSADEFADTIKKHAAHARELTKG